MMSTNGSSSPNSPPRKIQRLEDYPPNLKFISLDREFLTEVSSVTFAVLKNFDKKHICKILKELPELSSDYRHLKRVNDEKHVLVAPRKEFNVEEFHLQLSNNYGNEIEIYYKEVSASPSELRLHFEKANLLWPVRYVENRENEKLYWNRCVDDSEFDKYYSLLKSIGNEKGCIIYDPKIDKVLVQTVDNSKDPLAHAVMNAAKELTNLNEPERYYAFECDVILSHEPCVMCTMALNHMRASRVFFHRDDPKIGAFTRIKLHRNWTSCYRYNITMYHGFTVGIEIDGRLDYVSNDSLKIYATCFRRYFERYNKCAAIGIAMKQSPAFVAAVMEMLKQEIPFAYLQTDPLKYAWTMAERFFVSAIISDCKLEGSAIFEEIKVFNEVFYFYNLKKCQLSEMFDTKGRIFAYGTQTSGTTGEPKTVYVPKQCIDSNIKDMSKAFLDPNEDNYIFWGTHPSFDPSILELLLAIETNSALIIPPSNWDKPTATPVPDFFNSKHFKINFMQTTPTKLMMMPNERLRWIFKKDSSIKNLFIGGEIFPVTFLNQIVSSESTVNIFNIYGVTEVSCWATLSSPIKFPRSILETSIGSNMSDTEVEIGDNRKIYIKSEIRECVINLKWNGKRHFTGDYGYKKEGEIFVSGRIIGKRKGLKQSTEIKDYILKTYSVSFNIVNVLQAENLSALIIVVLPKNGESKSLSFIEETIKKDIFASFPTQIQSNWILAIYNNELKVTKNGKIDIESIIAEKLSSKNTLQLLQDLNIDMALPFETPLFTLGLDSLRYLELAAIIQPILAKIFPSPMDFLNHIRNPKFTLGDLSRFVFINFKENNFIHCENVLVQEIQKQEFQQKIFKTDACVEVPIIEMGDKKKFYVFGSFAGDVYILNSNGTLIDKKYLGAPIEVPALIFHQDLCGFIAASNGRICKIDYSGMVHFFVKLPGELRCPLISNHEYIYTITTEKLLWRIHYLTGKAEAVYVNTSCRGAPLIHNKFIYIPGLNEFVIVDTENLLVVNHLLISNPMFTNAFIWKDFIIGICAPGEIILVDKDNQIMHAGYGPPTCETPLILTQKIDESEIWIFGGYFQSLLFTKVYYKNSKIIIEPLKRLIFPKTTGIINIPLNIEEKFWTISCNRCYVFFFAFLKFNEILEKSSLISVETISTVLNPENSSLVQPKFYRVSPSQGALFFSTRNDSMITMDITKLLDNFNQEKIY